MYKCVFRGRILLILVLLWIIPTGSIAINSDQWQIEHIQIDDGLPDSTVYSVTQDKTGFVWFGTTSGLARFDGNSFKSFKHDGADPSSISNNNAGNIFIDSQNRVWIGTFGGGVNLLDLTTGDLTRFPYSSSQYKVMVSENVQTFFEDESGHIWIGTATGLYRYDGKDMMYFDANQNGTVQSRVWDIVADEAGMIWLGTSDGLSQLNPNTGQFKHIKLPPEMTIDITTNQFRTLLYKTGMLWIGSSSGLFSYNIKLQSFEFHSPNQESIKINDIYKTPDEDILLASMEGLYLYNTQKNIFKRENSGDLWQQLSHVDIRDIYVDRSGIMWLATRDNGVYKIDLAGGLFQHHTNYLPESQLNEKAKQVWSIESDQDGTIYLGTSETVFRQNSENSFQRIETAGLDMIPGYIRDIETSDKAGLWVSGSTGLYFLPRDSEVAELISTPFDLVGIEPADVFSVEITEDGEMWLALYNLGILRWNPDKDQAELIQSYNAGALTDLNISHIKEDSRKNIWIGSNLVGLFKYDNNSKQIMLYNHDFNDPKSIASNRIKDVFEDSQGRLWIATPQGLCQYRYQSDDFQHFTKSDGLINNSVNFVLEDSQQNLWLGNKFGLSQFNPESEEIKNYLLNTAIRHDGMITRSSTIGNDDVIWLGSANGFYTFNPADHENLTTYEPPLVMTSIKIDNRPLNAANLEYSQQELVLDHSNQLVSFDFTVLDYKTPEQIQYLYRLVGLHEDWLDVSNTRQIVLKELNPGNYQLEIKASSNDGSWYEQKMNLYLLVQPVWWERGWVRALFVLTALMLAVFFHYYRTYKIRKQNLLLENEVNNRTIELQGLNEQLELAANSDYLTGLPNRMAFINAYEELLKDPKAAPLNSCIVMGDVDRFKNINDQYGHSAGDEILIQVSAIMKKLLRAEDLIARWGGEEFIFYFANKDADATSVLIERIRLAIETTQIQYQDHEIPVTMTFGICQRTVGMSLIDCINAADESMYQGKASGRNTVVVHGAT